MEYRKTSPTSGSELDEAEGGPCNAVTGDQVFGLRGDSNTEGIFPTGSSPTAVPKARLRDTFVTSHGSSEEEEAEDVECAITERSRPMLTIMQHHEKIISAVPESPLVSPECRPKAKLRETFVMGKDGDEEADDKQATASESKIIEERSFALQDIIRKHETVTGDQPTSPLRSPQMKPKTQLRDSFIRAEEHSEESGEESVEDHKILERSQPLRDIIQQHERRLSGELETPQERIIYKPKSRLRESFIPPDEARSSSDEEEEAVRDRGQHQPGEEPLQGHESHADGAPGRNIHSSTAPKKLGILKKTIDRSKEESTHRDL